MALLTGQVTAQAKSTIVAVGASDYAFNLTTLVSIKRFLGLTSAFTKNDDFLTELIRNATDAIEKHTDRRLKKRIYVNDPTSVDTDGSGTEIIFLNEWPIISVQSVNLGFNSADLVPTDFAVYFHSGYIRLKERLAFTLQPQEFHREIPFGIQNVRVDYIAGFDPVPGDLRQAANRLVAHYYMNSPASGDSRMGLKSRSVRDQSETSIDDASMPTAVIDLLSTYKRQGFKSHRDSSSDSPL